MYASFFKRVIDFLLSLIALTVLSPILLVLMLVGSITMKGSPFFTQMRPGKKDKKTGQEKIFRLIKFRTMSNAKDKDGNLLPDDARLNTYGKILRASSLDELPELINILVGDMSIVGPRPLLAKYLPRYTPEQRHRHDVRPGLTGLAQVNGRNALSWEEKFDLDLKYAQNITLIGDIKIIWKTVISVLKHDGISSETSATMEEFMGSAVSENTATVNDPQNITTDVR